MIEELQGEGRAIVEMITEYWSRKRINETAADEHSAIREMIHDYWRRRNALAAKELK